MINVLDDCIVVLVVVVMVVMTVVKSVGEQIYSHVELSSKFTNSAVTWFY